MACASVFITLSICGQGTIYGSHTWSRGPHVATIVAIDGLRYRSWGTYHRNFVLVKILVQDCSTWKKSFEKVTQCWKFCSGWGSLFFLVSWHQKPLQFDCSYMSWWSRWACIVSHSVNVKSCNNVTVQIKLSANIASYDLDGIGKAGSEPCSYSYGRKWKDMHSISSLMAPANCSVFCLKVIS